MKNTTPAVVIRVFHRWSGLFLILLVADKIMSGFNLSGNIHIFSEQTASMLHFSWWIDVPLLFFFIFHALYGVLKILFTRGIENKVRAFILANLVGAVIFILALIFIV